MELTSPHCAIKQPDQWWHTLTDLCRLGELNYISSTGKTFNSNLFSAIIQDTASMGYNTDTTLVSLQFTWNADDLNTRFDIGLKAFKLLHKLNYMLYRSEYQKQHTKSRRQS